MEIYLIIMTECNDNSRRQGVITGYFSNHFKTCLFKNVRNTAKSKTEVCLITTLSLPSKIK